MRAEMVQWERTEQRERGEGKAVGVHRCGGKLGKPRERKKSRRDEVAWGWWWCGLASCEEDMGDSRNEIITET